jgi:hypothetical protein
MRNFALMVLSLFFLVFNAQASGNERFVKHFNHQEKIAIHGYDVLSYFHGTPEKGNPSFQVIHKDIAFLFSNLANATEFKRNPEKYIPAYGGWCATAMGMMNKKLDVNPDSYVIQNDKLYLFSTSMGPAKDMWLKDMQKLKHMADKNWSAISSH